MLRLIVIGSAAGGGFPQWNSNDPASKKARGGDPAAPPRTQSSIAVSADERQWVLFNASPDLRQQINSTEALLPRNGKRDSPVCSVVLTNGDVDHVAGLLTMREAHPFSIYATTRVLSVLQANSIFNVLNAEIVHRRPLQLGVAEELLTQDARVTGVAVDAVSVPGKVALYLENAGAGANFGTQAEDTIGLRIASRDGASHFFYVPGCAQMTEDLASRLKGAPLVLFDGTLWRDDEMIVAGVGQKTGK